jgi:hypothetical protein
MQLANFDAILVGTMVRFICDINVFDSGTLKIHVWLSKLVEHLVSLVRISEI